MTPAMLANFAMSEDGKLYGRVCQRWGVDPAQGLDDDVMAYNLRTALLMREAMDADKPTVERTPEGGIKFDGGLR